MVDVGVFADLSELPALQGLDGKEHAVGQAPLQGVVGLQHGHGGGRGPGSGNHLGRIGIALDPEALQVFNLVDRGFCMEKARTMGVEIEEFYVIIFLRFELLIEGIGHPGGLAAALVTEGKNDDLGEGHPSRRVGHDAQADIDDAFDDTVIGLIGRHQRAGREKGNLDAAVRPLLQLFAPLIGQNGEGMGGRQKTGILQPDVLLRNPVLEESTQPMKSCRAATKSLMM